MESSDFLDKDVELFIYEEGDLSSIMEEKANSNLHKKRERTRAASEGSRMNQIERTRSMPGSLLRNSSVLMRSSRYLQKYRMTDETHVDNLWNILSGLYAMFLVVVGASMPLAKVFAVDITVQILEGFYVYLFVVGIVFISFVYLVLIHDINPIRCLRNRLSAPKTPQGSASASTATAAAAAAAAVNATHDPWVAFGSRGRGAPQGSEAGETSSLRRSESVVSVGVISTATTTDRRSTTTTTNFSFNTKSGSDSFYLRLGAVAFGIGSVIHNGLEFGQFVEMQHLSQCHVDLVVILRPIFQLTFTFMQLYFIFINFKLRIHGYCTISRFGTMHMIATNLCVWLRVITIETVREIQKYVTGEIAELLGDVIDDDHHPQSHPDLTLRSKGNQSTPNLYQDHHSGVHRRAAAHHPSPSLVTVSDDLSCQETSLMAHLLNSASPYLYPCAVEYCLISAAIMFLIWNSIDQPPQVERRSTCRSPGSPIDLPFPLFGKRNQVTVDCSGANRGLFGGLLVLVLTVISIIIFFLFIDNPLYVHLAVVLEHVSLIVLYALAFVSVVLVAFRFRDMKFRPKRDRRLDETLLVLSLTGVYLFRIFSSIAGQYSTEVGDRWLVMSTNVIITVQATVQTVFILNGLRRCARTPRQESHKPGREYVTFLLVCNISIWATNTFEVLRSDANPVSMNFYGPVPWSIITHVAIPLTIFHQFHATVCLSTIWKTAYKLKST